MKLTVKGPLRLSKQRTEKKEERKVEGAVIVPDRCPKCGEKLEIKETQFVSVFKDVDEIYSVETKKIAVEAEGKCKNCGVIWTRKRKM